MAFKTWSWGSFDTAWSE